MIESPADAPVETTPDDGHSARRMTRGAVAMLSTQPFTWAAAVVWAILVPRYLGADGAGRFSIAWTIAGIAGLVASAGLPSYVTRKVAHQPERAAEFAWGGLAAVAISSLGVALILLTTLQLVHSSSIDLEIVAIGIAAAMTAAAQGIMTSVLMGAGRHVRYAFTSASYAIVGTVACTSALVLGAGVTGYAAAMLAGWASVTVLLWATSGMRPTRAAVRPALLRELFVGGLPFIGWSVALSVRGQADVVLAGLLLQPAVAGWLWAAYRIINFAVFIPTIIATPLLPALARIKDRPALCRKLLKDSLSAVLLLIVPVSAAIFALAPAIPSFLGWPAELEHSVPVMMILSFQQTLVAVDVVLGMSLIALGLERRWLRVAVVGAIFNPLLNLIAIPLAQSATANGAIGAAIVEVVTETLFLGGALILMPKGILGRDMLSTAARILGCGAVFVGVAVVLRPLGPFVAAGAGAVSYAILAVAVGALRPQQVRAVRLALRAA